MNSDYNIWRDLLDTYQSLSQTLQILWLIVPPIFVLALLTLPGWSFQQWRRRRRERRRRWRRESQRRSWQWPTSASAATANFGDAAHQSIGAMREVHASDVTQSATTGSEEIEHKEIIPHRSLNYER
ncbi:MAG: hypothetical protein ACR2O8_03325 [Rhizobiaceae bacterium]